MTLSNLLPQKDRPWTSRSAVDKFITDKQTDALLAKIETKYARVSFLLFWAMVLFYFFFLEQVQAKNIQEIVLAPSILANFFDCKPYERTEFIPNSKFNEPASNSDNGNHALWLQVGLGLASAQINHRYYPQGTFIHGEFNVHFRRRDRVIAIGLDGEGTEAWGINTIWGSYGYSYHLPTFEAALSSGIGLSSWYHDTESSRGTIRSPKVPCLLARLELICHLPQIIGLGFFFTGNINRESSYVAGGIAFNVGVWNL